jgi:hypothetical protein
MQEESMSDHLSQEPDPVRELAHEPWGPRAGLNPIQEYRALAAELQEAFPDAEPRQLDCMIAREMALYGGYSVDVIVQALVAASLHLTGRHGDDPQDYVRRTVEEALQQARTDDTVLGWGE